MSRFTPTKIQKTALSLLKSNAKYILLYGGSRSGKTRIEVEYLFRMAIKYPGMRILVARQVYSHAINTLWNQTFKDVKKTYHKEYPHENIFIMKESTHVVEFVNGSEIWLAGLDDAERMEKILGGEYALIYLNECSQIKYSAVTIIKTRLAQNIKDFTNLLIFDENPPSPKHWTYKLFIQNIDPLTGENIEDANKYKSLLMNPKDNIEYLPDDYITTLESLPERDKKRFLYGEFVKIEGAIYDKFDLGNSRVNDLPNMDYYTVGIDNTGNNMASILIGFSGNKAYCIDEYNAYRMSMSEFNSTIYSKWSKYNYVAYPDPAAGPLNDLIWNMMPADNAVSAGINHLRELMEQNRFFVYFKNGENQCPLFCEEVESYRYDDKGRIVKTDDHVLDAARYAIYSHAKYGGSILQEISIY